MCFCKRIEKHVGEWAESKPRNRMNSIINLIMEFWILRTSQNVYRDSDIGDWDTEK